jgi:hypothetical protein
MFKSFEIALPFVSFSNFGVGFFAAFFFAVAFGAALAVDVVGFV